MKYLFGLIVVSLAVSGSIALPARSPDNDAEVIDLPRIGPKNRPSNFGGDAADHDGDQDFNNFNGVIDTGVGYPFLQPSPHAFGTFNSFFDSIEDVFRRLRLWPIVDAETNEDANTTSVVKVVDGHKIEINDTVYSNGDENQGAVFKFRIINIRPIDSSEETDADSNRNPVTSAPSNNNNENDSDPDSDSDERKESLEDTKSVKNEIKRNVDGPEVNYDKTN